MRTRPLQLLVVSACLLGAQQTPLDRAWDLLAQGKRAEAKAEAARVSAALPKEGEPRLMLGSILAEEGNFTEALPQLQEAVRLMPASAVAQNALGEAYQAVGDSKTARAAFENAVRLDGSLGAAHANLGQVLLETGDSAAAVKHLDRAIALLGQSPDAAHSQYLRARIYADQEEPEKAVALLKQAVALQPDFAEAWSDLGQAHKSLREYAPAFAAFERSVRLDPGNAVSQYRLGAEYLRLRKPHEAVSHLQESFRLNPRNQSTLYSLQLALRQDGQAEEAERVKQKLAELLRGIDRESQAAFTALRMNNEGAVLEKAGKLQDALEKYRAAVALDPGHTGIRVNHGVLLLRLGRWAEGLTELREALRRDPNNTQAKAALADALEQAPLEFGGKGRSAGPRPALPLREGGPVRR